MTTFAITMAGLVLAGLGYLLDRRINSAVSWSARHERSGGDHTVLITHTGVSRAHSVTVELDPEPQRLARDARPPVYVDRGAVVIVQWTRLLGDSVPNQVTVRWTRRLRRDGVWTTPI